MNQNLIQRFSSFDPDDRPTFDEIVFELRNNHEYILDSTDKEEFQNYIKYLDESLISFNDSLFDNFIIG